MHKIRNSGFYETIKDRGWKSPPYNLVDLGGSGFQPLLGAAIFPPITHPNTASIHPQYKHFICLFSYFIAFSSQCSFISIKLASEWICRLPSFFIHN
jgi:hypothetical protein